jgi:CDP-diglyceride synthetase
LAPEPGIRLSGGGPSSDAGSQEKTMGFIFGIIWFVLFITLGIISIRKGHWVMFILGIFIPLFWIIGALMPSRRELR